MSMNIFREPKTKEITAARPICSACNHEGHIAKNCFCVTGRFPNWWGDRPRDRIYLPITDKGGFASSSSRGRPRQTGRTVGVRAHMATGGSSSSRGSSLTENDKLDLNNLSQSEWEELNLLWQNRKNNGDQFKGKASDHAWVIDTGTSHHMSGNIFHFINLVEIDPCPVGMPNGELALATQRGDIPLGPNLLSSTRPPRYTGHYHAGHLD
ncbi:hypothetical protein RND81_11G089200 [Saponaria officinalis]|uniref:CCHC-type domain-containing protein n=1 Tax=Saponaria officinalis TaxID=3572 RepID=A0AAW1HJT7_SAPOF